MDKSEYERQFNILYNQFLHAVRSYYVWKGIQEAEQEDVMERNSRFWGSVNQDLQESWLIKTARLYEDSSYTGGGKAVSVYGLLPHQDEQRQERVQEIIYEHEKTIKYLKDIRDDQLAHNNVEHLDNPNDITEEYSVTYEDIQGLLDASDEILGLLNPEEGHAYSLDMIRDHCAKSSENVLEALEFYFEKKDEHMEDFKNGKVDDPTFPPKT